MPAALAHRARQPRASSSACGASRRRIPGVLVAVVAAGVVVGAWPLGGPVGRRRRAPRPADDRPPGGHMVRPRDPLPDGARHRPHLVRRHERHLARLRRPPRRTGRRRPELAALGIVNVAAGLVSGLRLERQRDAHAGRRAAGPRTQVTGLVGARRDPRCCSSSCPASWRPCRPPRSPPSSSRPRSACSTSRACGGSGAQRRSELGLALVAFLGVTVFGALPGSRVAVGLSLLNFIRHAWRPHDAVLGRVASYKGYHDVGRHPEARLVPGLILYRWDAPALLRQRRPLPRAHPRASSTTRRRRSAGWPSTSEPMTDIDTTAADMLDELDHGARPARRGARTSPR